MAKLDSQRYSASIRAESGEVVVDIQDSGEGPQRSGHVALYYDGPEAYGDLPEFVAHKRVVATYWETDTPNVHGGETLRYNAPQRFVDGEGRWIVYFGAEDDPIAERSAKAAREG
jgi:hypothetical protein